MGSKHTHMDNQPTKIKINNKNFKKKRKEGKRRVKKKKKQKKASNQTAEPTFAFHFLVDSIHQPIPSLGTVSCPRHRLEHIVNARAAVCLLFSLSAQSSPLGSLCLRSGCGTQCGFFKFKGVITFSLLSCSRCACSAGLKNQNHKQLYKKQTKTKQKTHQKNKKKIPNKQKTHTPCNRFITGQAKCLKKPPIY